MKAVTRYLAEDGSEWPSKAQAFNHENLCLIVDVLLNQLQPVPNDPIFGRGQGFIQQDIETVKEVRARVLDLVIGRFPADEETLEKLKGLGYDLTFVSKLLGRRDEPINAAINRLDRIDAEGREWGQYFYAWNPEHREEVRLNP